MQVLPLLNLLQPQLKLINWQTWREKSYCNRYCAGLISPSCASASDFLALSAIPASKFKHAQTHKY
jgi:hypothetical protein